MKSFFLSLFILPLFFSSCAQTGVNSMDSKSPPIVFNEGGKEYKADLMLPKNMEKPVPLVIVVHEWWGKNAYAQKRGSMLADEGYAALVVDLFGNGELAKTPDEAKVLTQAFYTTPELGVKRLNRYLELAKKEARVDSTKIYAIGYCFGGTQVLNLARSGANLKGVASFHGNLKPFMPMKASPGLKVLVLNGAADASVTSEDLEALKKEMKEAKVPLILQNYEGARHAFTNPDATVAGKRFKIPVAYNEAADKASWEELKDFLK